MLAYISFFIVDAAILIVGLYLIYNSYIENSNLLSPPDIYLDYWLKKVYAQYGVKGLKYIFTFVGTSFVIFSIIIFFWFVF